MKRKVSFEPMFELSCAISYLFRATDFMVLKDSYNITLDVSTNRRNASREIQSPGTTAILFNSPSIT